MCNNLRCFVSVFSESFLLNLSIYVQILIPYSIYVYEISLYMHYIDTKKVHYTYTTHSKTHNCNHKYISEYTYSTNKHGMYIHARTLQFA